MAQRKGKDRRAFLVHLPISPFANMKDINIETWCQWFVRCLCWNLLIFCNEAWVQEVMRLVCFNLTNYLLYCYIIILRRLQEHFPGKVHFLYFTEKHYIRKANSTVKHQASYKLNQQINGKEWTGKREKILFRNNLWKGLPAKPSTDIYILRINE